NRLMSPLAAAASLLAARVATAEEPARRVDPGAPGEGAARAAGAAEIPISALLALSFGRGLRFNNPYRLATPLGDTAESVSLAATYLDLGGALLFGPGDFRQGMALSGSVALQGIGQLVLTPSYLALFGVSDDVALRGRAGIPVVVAPDTTAGLEGAVGASLGVAYGLGVVAELIGSIFFGAATDERSITTIPMLSLQLGICFDHQVAR
ncbi:MAG TPA: hypothetical protein VNN80_01135, partial [Polyangiaceae bacterium]|nr:hypothetical protein [Polyangiaceae bacterium]